jgi:hypothetical protein
MIQILNNETLIQTTIYFKFYLFEALQKTGHADKYLSLLDSWEKMLDDGLTTFAEGDYKDRSDCHAWSASPLYHFLSSVGGIRSYAPGFKSVKIEPRFGPLNKLNIEIPHPNGLIKMDLSKKGKSLEGSIELPEDLKGVLIWLDKQIVLKAGLQKINF